MASTDVQQPVSLEPSDHSALDGILRHHLTLEAPPRTGDSDQQADSQTNLKTSQNKVILQTQSSTSSGHKATRQFSRPTVHQNTLESDNKRRPIVLKRNSSRYRPPSPEPPDPNSEAKSVTIRRMQSNLLEWDKKLDDINAKKLKDEAIQQAEMRERDDQIKELTEKLANETEGRKTAEEHRDDLEQRLASTEDELGNTKDQCDQLQSDLTQYEAAYEEISAQRMELEEQLSGNSQLLQQSESMRRRLDDTVIELQGQLAIEEQRSKFCSIM
ncbi:uncharacterized protein LOC135344628 [Halichondria panicea]|uniref:uncharacterized protein LOC135344628 n=1 Tax=Halichondria panicea TaxID=6063 RepID=UPI00312B7975